MKTFTSLNKVPVLRLLPMMAAIFFLLAGGWLGLARTGWRVPARTMLMFHGPLMISGFFGTLIGMERAVALQKRWANIAPGLCAVGTFLLLLGMPQTGKLLIFLSSLFFWILSALMAWKYRALFASILALAGFLWVVGNGLWLSGWAVYQIVHWWIAFLVITIAGERLELARVARITRQGSVLLGGILALLVIALSIILIDPQVGVRLLGLCYLGLAGWLFIFDIARRTVRTRGLPRYVAVCLLGGYIWLVVGGAIALYAGSVTAGFLYDALLHAILLGFIMSMLFGHAPIILPALLNRPLNYFPLMYLPQAILYISLIARLIADFVLQPIGRQWAGLMNGTAIILFLVMMSAALLQAKQN